MKRSLRQLGRRAATKKPKLRIALVCEGEKTEQLYFSLFVDELRAANVRLEIMDRECGSDPLSVVRFAQERFAGDNGIDTCFCVIDRDTHHTFDAAVELAATIQRKMSRKRKFRLIVSYPCFEFWFILHFGAYRRPFVASGRKSAGDNAVAELKSRLPSYKKTCLSSMKSLIADTSTAIRYADVALRDALKSGELNPSTEVHLLVQYLIAAKGESIPESIEEQLWP